MQEDEKADQLDADNAIQLRASAMNTGLLVAGLIHSTASRHK